MLGFFQLVFIFIIIIMVFVSPFVMQPRRGDTKLLSGNGVGTAIAGIELGTGKKFRWCVFGQIMADTLTVKPDGKAIFGHQACVLGDGAQMIFHVLECDGHVDSSLFFLCQQWG